MKDFFTSRFDHLFGDDEDIQVANYILPTYSTNIDSLDHYFKEWDLRYKKLKSVRCKVEENMLKMLYKLRDPFLSLLVVLSTEYERSNNKPPSHKILRGLFGKKMKSILSIGDRQELRYWNGTWRLIELLHITQCSSNILVESQITANYLTTVTSNSYDIFLKSLLGDNEVSHRSFIFDEFLMQEVKEVVRDNIT